MQTDVEKSKDRWKIFGKYVRTASQLLQRFGGAFELSGQLSNLEISVIATNAKQATYQFFSICLRQATPKSSSSIDTGLLKNILTIFWGH